MKEVGIKPVESSNQRGEALAAPLSVIDHLSLEYGQSREIMNRKNFLFVLIFFVCLSEQLLSLKTFCNFVKQFSQIVGKRQFSIVVECRESMQSNLSATQTWLIKLRGSN